MNFKDCLQEKKSAINRKLEEYIVNIPDANVKLLDSMKYSLMSNGKRVRGILVMEFFKLFGGNYEDVLPFASAMEMIHTYSLIHDDLPCMDNDDMRRGKPSNHKVYGEDTALLAGDGLLTLAFEILFSMKLLKRFGGEKLIKVYKAISSAIGVEGMISGQADDLFMEGKKYSVEKIFRMYRKKTGMLIEASAKIGAVLSDASDKQIELVKLYGENIGMAFQLVDDLLDVIGQEEVMGKPNGSDESNGKFTYLYAYGQDCTCSKVREFTDKAMHILDKLGGNNEFLKQFTQHLAVRVK